MANTTQKLCNMALENATKKGNMVITYADLSTLYINAVLRTKRESAK